MIADASTAEVSATLLAALAAFLCVFVWIVPDGADRKLQARFKAVARERGRLREERLQDLAMQSKTPLRPRQSLLMQIIPHWKTKQTAGSQDLAAKLRTAGYRNPGAEAVFLFIRMAGPVFGATLCVTILAVNNPGGIVSGFGMALIAASAALGYTLPRLLLGALISRRQTRIQRALPDALDLLLICVQSGLSVEAALGRMTKDMPAQCIELAEELGLTLAELSYLPVRWRAYANLGERIGLPSVKLITAALVQAERHGTSISQALHSAALAGRDARIAEAEYKAAALPAKLSVPLVAFFLPVLLTVILAPAVIEAGRALKDQGQTLIETNEAQSPTHRQDAPASPSPLTTRRDRSP